MRLGRVTEIWRYPVKSMGGERLQQASVGRLGVPGDRGWALRDETARRGARREEVPRAAPLPGALPVRARGRRDPAAPRSRCPTARACAATSPARRRRSRGCSTPTSRSGRAAARGSRALPPRAARGPVEPRAGAAPGVRSPARRAAPRPRHVPARAPRVHLAARHLLRRLSAPPPHHQHARRAGAPQRQGELRPASLPPELPDRARRRRSRLRRERLVREGSEGGWPCG